MDQPWPKAYTVAALLIGMAVALGATSLGIDRVPLIIFAQALTVIGVPILAAALLYLAAKSSAPTPNWLLALAASGTLLTLLLAVRTGWRIYLQVT
jgi:Mn2+/Fe2+ NRAMP family transporter